MPVPDRYYLDVVKTGDPNDSHRWVIIDSYTGKPMDNTRYKNKKPAESRMRDLNTKHRKKGGGSR